MIKSIIFDFDGVIVESNDVKTGAFVQLFKEYPLHITEQIRKFHLQNGGMSRFDKFRYIYANIIKESLSDEKFNELCDDFKRFVFEGVVNAPAIPGVENFLKRNKSKYHMYIVSGTPQEEIREIVKRRNLGKYFYGVYGSPMSKEKLIENILRENAYTQKEVVFLGDSINDYEGAAGAGVEFVAKIFDGMGKYKALSQPLKLVESLGRRPVSCNLDIDQFPGITIKTKIKTIKEFEQYLAEKT